MTASRQARHKQGRYPKVNAPRAPRPGPLGLDPTDPGTRAAIDRMRRLDPPVTPEEDEAWREREGR